MIEVGVTFAALSYFNPSETLWPTAVEQASAPPPMTQAGSRWTTEFCTRSNVSIRVASFTVVSTSPCENPLDKLKQVFISVNSHLRGPPLVPSSSQGDVTANFNVLFNSEICDIQLCHPSMSAVYYPLMDVT